MRLAFLFAALLAASALAAAAALSASLCRLPRYVQWRDLLKVRGVTLLCAVSKEKRSKLGV